MKTLAKPHGVHAVRVQGLGRLPPANTNQESLGTAMDPRQFRTFSLASLLESEKMLHNTAARESSHCGALPSSVTVVLILRLVDEAVLVRIMP